MFCFNEVAWDFDLPEQHQHRCCSPQEDRLTSCPVRKDSDQEPQCASVTITKVFDFAGEEVRYVLDCSVNKLSSDLLVPRYKESASFPSIDFSFFFDTLR